MRRIAFIITMAVIMAAMPVLGDLPTAVAQPLTYESCGRWHWDWFWSDRAHWWYWQYYRDCDSGRQWDGWGWA